MLKTLPVIYCQTELLPNGKKQGSEWCVGSVQGEVGDSLKVRLTGNKAVIWCDFAIGEKGDLLDLWAAIRQLNLSEAIKEATHYLGIAMPHFEAHKPHKFTKPVLKYTNQLNHKSSVMSYLMNERKLGIETINAYKIGEQNRQIIFPYWRDNELIFVKYLGLDRINGKKQIVVESNCEPCLFGWDLIPANVRTIIICEGEIDTLSLYQYGLPALSVPFGGGGGNKQKWLEYEFDRLAIFDELYLCLDNDKEGYIATKELIERLGRHRCRVVKLPYKDANECLQNGISKKAMHQYISEARTLDPEELKSAAEFVDQVIEEFYPPSGTQLGYESPWIKTKNKLFLGLMSFPCGVVLTVMAKANSWGKSSWV
ncbi:MAG: toprim domain-containing protein [Legionella sp.]|uniref:toprim domain-containing protein n=1 Tax=Legionella sp. TaxID=459 RepID=UPI0039E5E46E